MLSRDIYHIVLSRDIPTNFVSSRDILGYPKISHVLNTYLVIEWDIPILIGIYQDMQVFVWICPVTRWLVAHIGSGPRRAGAAGHHVCARACSYADFPHTQP